MINVLYETMLKGLWFVQAPGGALIIYPKDYYDEGRLFTKHGLSTVLNSVESIAQVINAKKTLASIDSVPLSRSLEIFYGERKSGSKLIYERKVSVYDAKDIDQKVISILILITLKYRKYIFGRELFDLKFYSSWGTLVSGAIRREIAVSLPSFSCSQAVSAKMARTFTEEQLNKVLSQFSQSGNRINTNVLVRELFNVK